MDLEVALLSELEKTLGDGEGQGGLVCCSAWGCKVLDTTGWLNSNKSNILSQVSLTQEKYRMTSLIRRV